jgi:hypothetical protein
MSELIFESLLELDKDNWCWNIFRGNEKMSVKELKFEDSLRNAIRFKFKDGGLYIHLLKENAYLDRNQADLLRLYLTEHLNK